MFYQALEIEPPRLRLDADDLRQRFYARSRLLHPDRFARKSPAEQQAALDASSVLNDAYRTLRDPVLRAEYFLEQRGIAAGSATAPPDLLEEVFAFNEALEESDAEQLAEAREKFETLRTAVDTHLDELFTKFDETANEQVLHQIRAQLNRRRYLSNLIATANGERIQH